MDTDRQADPYGRGSYCIVVALHGAESSESEALRAFRDRVLRRLPGGDRVVDAYYRASPRIDRFLQRHTALQTATTVATAAVARTVRGVLPA